MHYHEIVSHLLSHHAQKNRYEQSILSSISQAPLNACMFRAIHISIKHPYSSLAQCHLRRQHFRLYHLHPAPH